MLNIWKKRFGVLGLLAVLLAAVLVAVPTASLNAQARTRFYVYYPVYVSSGAYVFPVEFSVPYTVAPARAALERLIAGLPENPVLDPIIPRNVVIRGITISNQVAHVDFSAEMRNLSVGSGGEAAVIAAIVNTLCQFPTVQSVKLYIEGQAIDSLAGHIDASVPLQPDRSMIFTPFEDVQQHWSGGAVGMLQLLDIVSGYETSDFRPERTLSRAEFVKLVVQACKFEQNPGAQVSFADLPASHWSYPYVATAVANGIVVPSEHGTAFRPDEPIPRQEMALILVRAWKALYGDIPSGLEPRVFTDEGAIAPNYLQAVREASALGLLRGYPDGSFGPTRTLKRSEAATVIVRLLKMDCTQLGLLYPKSRLQWTGNDDVFVLGMTSAFEGTVNYRVVRADGTEVFSDYTTASQGMGWGAFGICVTKDRLAGQNPSALEVYLLSAKDGSVLTKTTVELR